MKSVRWAIIGMGVFAATATFAVAQSGAFGRLARAIGSDDASVAANQGSVDGGQAAQDFRWAGSLDAGEAVEIKGINGDISVTRASGSEIEIVAEARGRKSDPSTVRIERVDHADGITFCAVYPTPEGEQANECAPGSSGRMNTHRNDVAVDFEVRLPANLDFIGRTVNGEILAHDLGGDVTANTVNGDIEVSTEGFARAETVNGDIDVVMGAPDFAQGAEFSTVNGSITLDVADGVDADVRASWLNGGFESELPFTLDGRIGKRSARGMLGDGGPELELETVNGSIRIR
jgi:hypothetical protein